MVTVTEEAAAFLKTMIDDRNGDRPLRIVFEDNQPSLAFDDEQQGDQVIDHDGTPVLLLGEAAQSTLDGLTITCVDTDNGTQLTIQRAA